jgi:hypothetical protein
MAPKGCRGPLRDRFGSGAAALVVAPVVDGDAVSVVVLSSGLPASSAAVVVVSPEVVVGPSMPVVVVVSTSPSLAPTVVVSSPPSPQATASAPHRRAAVTNRRIVRPLPLPTRLPT